MRQLIALGAAGVAALVGDVPSAALAAEPASDSAAQPERAEMCVVDLDSRTFVGCFDDEIDARAGAISAGVVSPDGTRGWAGTAGQVMAVHYEHHYAQGDSMSYMFTGSCNYNVKVSGYWSSRLSSTSARACSVKHLTGSACDGASESTPANSFQNLGPALNDNVRCLSYS
jgi:hypothetical protein